MTCRIAMSALVALGLSFLATPLAAQALRFDGGPVAGINASQVQGDDYTGFNKLGLSGGAFIDIRNPENYWGVRLEMHYAEKGSRRGGDPEVGTTTIELRMNYIDIPILLDVNLGDYQVGFCLLYTSPSPRDRTRSRMPSSA